MHDDAHDAIGKSGIRIRRWLAAILLLGVVGLVALITVWRRQGQALELAIAKVPSGITVAEADRLLGGPPDEVSQTSGVLVHGVTLIAANNPDVAKYGSPSNFEIRRWNRGDVHGFLLIGEDGKVAGRMTVRDGLRLRQSGLYGWWGSRR